MRLRTMKIFKLNLEIKINKLVQFFILSDLFFLAGWGLVEPIFAVFVVENIPGASLITVGWGVAIYLGVKSLLQTPLAFFLDKADGETDDFYAIVLGLMLFGAASFSYLAVQDVRGFYLVQVLRGVAMACYAAAWPAVFARHLDRNKQAFEWSLNSTINGVSAALAGLGGSAVASYLGYQILFVIVGFLALLSAAIMLFVPQIALPRKSISEVFSVRRDGSHSLPHM